MSNWPPHGEALSRRLKSRWIKPALMPGCKTSPAASSGRPKTLVSPFAVGGDVVVIPSEMGYRLASDGLAQRIARAAVDPYARAVRVTVNPVEPAWTTVDAEALGIRKQIASFTTRFHPADVNRTANIYVAAQALDGTILRPGELFSFNQRVGPRVEAAGYKEAPVIINGELVPDIGGGVCQVSTTLYGAVLLAGLKVDARTPHSIPVSYVPMGLDAAVVYDAVDFRFQNNTSGHLLVRAWVEQDRLTVALYGEGPADRPVGLETEIVEVIAAPMVRVVRPELAGGEQRIVRAGREGYRVPRVAGDRNSRRDQKAGACLPVVLPRPGTGDLGRSRERGLTTPLWNQRPVRTECSEKVRQALARTDQGSSLGEDPDGQVRVFRGEVCPSRRGQDQRTDARFSLRNRGL